MSSRIDRGPRAKVKLYFDGAASPNPGPAAWGAKILVHIDNLPETILCSAPIGHATSNVAEYLGLISALRKVISFLQSNDIRHSYVDVKVYGDSQLVVHQMSGHYRVSSPLLTPLHTVATHLAAQFWNVQFFHCSREQNKAADRLAKDACEAQVDPREKAIFYPSLMNFVDAWVGNIHTLASHDLGTAGSDPSFFIDSTFLYNLPGGKRLLASIRDPYPLSIVLGKVNLTVLGTITANVGISFYREHKYGPQSEPEQIALVNLTVVHAMPVPLHISIRYPGIDGPKHMIVGNMTKFSEDNLSSPYSKHPYWDESNVIFIGHEHT